nr:hypothetical protein [uncultured Rhodopila sp.]
MSSFTGSNTAPRLFSTGDTWGEAQIVAMPDRIVLDIQSRNYDSTGQLRQDHALANMPIRDAIRLRGLLGKAIAAAAEVTPPQPGPWSDTVNAASEARTRRAVR